MKREIKFRAWDRKTKSMIQEVFEVGLGDKNNPEKWLVGDDRQTDNFDLMQFTGLLDKNRKEIYEGDIASIECIFYKGINQFESKLQEASRIIKNFVIKYDNGSFIFSNSLYKSLSLRDFVSWNQENEFYNIREGQAIEENSERFGHYSKNRYIFIEIKGNIYQNPELLTNPNNKESDE